MSSDIPIHQEVKLNLNGVDGNAFSILGAMHKVLRKAKVPQADIDAITKEATDGDYDHLLQTVMLAVDVSFGSGDDDDEEDYDYEEDYDEDELDDDDEDDE